MVENVELGQHTVSPLASLIWSLSLNTALGMAKLVSPV